MKRAAWITWIYAFLIVIGGIIGLVKADSYTSFFMGTIFGILLCASGVGIFKNKLLPAYIAVILTLILTGVFLFRYLSTFHFFPTGLLCLISFAALVGEVITIKDHLLRERNR